MTDPAYPDALPAQSRLHWYVVERVLGQGGFGITYLARDTNLDRVVAIKEYLPVDAATRMPDATIRARTDELRDRYRWGLERFIQEARTLARFDHQNIVHVHSVFEFNNTAYMVMRFESGVTLAALLDRRGTLPEDDLLRIILPVLDGLELVHNAGFIHRDVKPDNIHIGSDGTPVLLDFGSARQALGVAHTLTILVAPGYAPFEQYYSDSASQGPWTDIYGLGATCYRAIAGRPPLDAVSRSKGVLGSTQDVMVPATIIGAGRYSGRVLAAIDHALAFAEKDRPQSLAEWRAELLGASGALAVPPRMGQPIAPAAGPPGASVNTPVNSQVMRTTTLDREIVSAAAATPLVSQSPTPQSSLRIRGHGKWIIAGMMAAAIAGAGIYVFSKMRDEAKSRIDQLEAQVKEKDRAAEKQAEAQRAEAQRAEAARPAADADRVAKEKAEADAHQRQEKEQQARIAQEKSRVDGARKREMEAKTKPAERPAEQPPRAAAAAMRATERPAAALDVTPTAMMVPSQPATIATTSAAPEPSLPKVAPPPALDAEKPAPVTPAAQLALADRAISEGKFADALAALKPLADAGNAQAQTRLGDMYAEARGTTRDAAAAKSWYEKAALQGDTSAQMKLGAIYASASSGARNNNLAYMWYGTAARLGATGAKAESDRIGALLQPAERAQADRAIESTVRSIRKNL
jgi:serine/threonine protein kinase/TPR repeat protein